jgi:hypothetical protein
MTGSRNKYAWVWVAIAAISLASVSRSATGSGNSGACANPVLHFLVKSHNTSAAAKSGAVRFAEGGSLFRNSGCAAWMAFLPVCFIGIVLLSLRSARPLRVRWSLPADPFLAASLQRPPPPVFA